MSLATGTLYCPTCGNSLLTMPDGNPACARCGRRLARPLIPSVPPIHTPPGIHAPRIAPSAAATGHPTPGIVVALLLYFFFPVGLYILWTHPVWTEKQKWKYTIVWLSAYGGLLLFSLVFCLVMAVATHAFK